MQLKSLHINGFKSFAKKADIEFTTPITAIVGPNGSGKSNVAEGFRFVLGEQSIKSMRGKKGEDLIWGGSEGTARSNRASVTVVLDNTEQGGQRTFPLDFDEIKVERVVHRDGTNEYSINGSKTRLKDVQELLASANIGSTGHHIISQGEADRILSASPRERREMIEDALGLKVFQYKKAESERKLRKTKENISHVESLRKEVLPHLKFLERQVKKLEKSLQLQEKLKVFYTDYLRREDTYIAHHRDRLSNEKKVPEERLGHLKAELALVKDKLAKEESNEKGEELIVLERKISDTREHRQRIVREIGQLEGQITYLEHRIQDLQKKNESSDAEATIPYGELVKVTNSVEKSAEHAIASEDASLLERTLSDIVHSLRALLTSAKSSGGAVSIQHEEKDLRELEEQKSKADESLAVISEKEDKLHSEYEALKASIEADSKEGREAEREVFRIMNEEREAEQTLQGIERELSELERDRNDFKRELQEAVTLLGEGASKYYESEIKNEDGSAISPESIVGEDREVQRERRRELEKMKIRLEDLGEGSNADLMKEYKDVKERDEFLGREIADLEESVAKLEQLIDELTAELNEQFVSGMDKIGEEFARLFVLMFGGGEAALERVKPKAKKKKKDDLEEGLSEDEDEGGDEENDEPEEGIEIRVKLPNKRVKGLEMLSGGERALTSIALIFAMSQINPPLFIVLDETDAALDEANSKRYGDMIESLAEKSQLILITHNRETMGRAGVLYGITMAGDGVSKLLSVKFDEAVAVAK